MHLNQLCLSLLVVDSNIKCILVTVRVLAKSSQSNLNSNKYN